MRLQANQKRLGRDGKPVSSPNQKNKMSSNYSGSLPLITEDSQRVPLQSRQTRNENLGDLNQESSHEFLKNINDFTVNQKYLNENEEPESNNVKDIIKHGNKSYTKQKDQQFQPFQNDRNQVHEVIETDKEGQESSCKDLAINARDNMGISDAQRNNFTDALDYGQEENKVDVVQMPYKSNQRYQDEL